jgi:hypothetical protein
MCHVARPRESGPHADGHVFPGRDDVGRYRRRQRVDLLGTLTALLNAILALLNL